jgi:hypothetical protein
MCVRDDIRIVLQLFADESSVLALGWSAVAIVAVSVVVVVVLVVCWVRILVSVAVG